jgi:TolB protein
MHNLKLPAVAALLLLLLFSAGPACGKVYIDIDSPSFQQFPIAVADFKPLQPFPGNENLSLLFSDTLSRDLTLTGYFHLLDRKAFLEDPKRAGITAEGIRFEDWTVIGAEYLVKGGFQTDGRELVAEFRLFDVVRGELVVGKRYAGKSGDHNRMVMQFVSEILLALTGETGLFDTRIAFVRKSAASTKEIYDMNVENSLLLRLTRDFSIDGSPVRSPDERRIAFVSDRNGSPQIYVMDADGANVRRLTYSGNYNTVPAWSPKGKKIAYEGSVNGRFQIFVIDADGGDPQQVTFEAGDHESPSWSPDGRYLAYSVRGYGRSRIEIMNAGGQGVRVLHEDKEASQSPFWSPHLR